MQYSQLMERGLAPRLMAPLLLFALAAGAASAQTTYAVTVNAPANAAPVNGHVSYEFDAGGAGSTTAVATVANIAYSSDYNLGAAQAFGSATTSSASLVIQNTPSNTFNVYSVAANPVGKVLSFDVTFAGNALNPTTPYASTGSDFYVSLLDSSSNPIWTTDSMGRVLDIGINPDGTFNPVSLYSGATVSLVVPAPEPAPWVAFAAGGLMLAGLGMMRARKRKVALGEDFFA